jgi:hypothetical protein
MSHNPSLSDLRRFNVRNLRGQGVVTAPATLAPAMPRTVRAFVPFAVIPRPIAAAGFAPSSRARSS